MKIADYLQAIQDGLQSQAGNVDGKINVRVYLDEEAKVSTDGTNSITLQLRAPVPRIHEAELNLEEIQQPDRS